MNTKQKVLFVVLLGLTLSASAQEQAAQAGNIPGAPAQGEVAGSGASGITPLPKTLSGEWRHHASSRLYTGNWGAQIEKEDGDGAIRGKLSFTGVSCHARNAEMTGTRRGKEVTLEAPIGTCGKGTFILTEVSPGRFQGEYSIEQAGPGKKEVSLASR